MEEIKSMTEEEFSKAASEVGWDDKWIQEVIEEARLDADIARAQKRKIIAIPVPVRLAMHWESAKNGPTFVEACISSNTTFRFRKVIHLFE